MLEEISAKIIKMMVVVVKIPVIVGRRDVISVDG